MKDQLNLINTALLSFGMSGRVFHAPFIHLHPGFALLGSWERSKKAIQEYYSDVESYESLEKVLSDASIELVIVNTPIYTHFEYAEKALMADKHIVVEKAFMCNSEEAIKIKELAQKVNKQVFVYQNRRWDSDFLTVKKIKESGILGEIVEAEFHFDRFNPNLSPKLHKELEGPGAGIVKDLGAHVIDQALSIFGMPDKVYADLRKLRVNTQAEDYFEILLFYPHLRVRLKGGYFIKEAVPSFQLHGRLGSFVKSRADRQEADLQSGKIPFGENWGMETEIDFGVLNTEKERTKIVSEKGEYMAFYENVFDTLRKNGQAAVSAQDGINCLKVIDAAFLSNHEQRVIELS
ncbi:Gfo/Idh/MocA family oxidoreductase [Aquirufa sp. ROCK-SH2]